MKLFTLFTYLINELARHTALKRWISNEIRWYTNVSRRSTVHSIAVLPISARKTCASSARAPSVCLHGHWAEDMAGWQIAVFGCLPLWRGCRCASCLHFATRKIPLLYGQLSRSMFRCALTAKVLPSSHHSCWDLAVPWQLECHLWWGHGRSGHWAKHDAELYSRSSCMIAHVDREDLPWHHMDMCEIYRLHNGGVDRQPDEWCCLLSSR